MKLNRIRAKNYKGFSNLSLQPEGKSMVVFGANGVGKTSALAIINYLCWGWINRINPAQGTTFKSLNADMVQNGFGRMEISVDIELDGQGFVLSKAYTKAKPGKGAAVEMNKKLYDTFVNHFTELYSGDDSNMPIFVNYGTNRSVLDIPLRIRKKHEFSKWSALERTLENELDYRVFFEWFRNQEDYESEKIREKQDFTYSDPLLSCVRQGVAAMLDGFENLKVKRNPLRLSVEKDGIELSVSQLSDGEKCTLALFGDLSRRLAIANPSLENPLHGEGIVLIDEIELHMHPSWQRKILGSLRNTFPNIQFIITTHSPQVLGEVNNSYQLIMLQKADDNSINVKELNRMDGYDSNFILEEYMETSASNMEFNRLVKLCKDEIAKGSFDNASKMIADIGKITDMNHSTVIMLEGMLKRGRILYEKNKG